MNTHKIHFLMLLTFFALISTTTFCSERGAETVLVICDKLTSGNTLGSFEKNGITDNRPTNWAQRDSTRIQMLADELNRKVTIYNDRKSIDNCTVGYLCLDQTSLGQEDDVNQLRDYINQMHAPNGIILVAMGAQAGTAVNYLASVSNSFGKEKLFRGFIAINPLINPNEATFHWIDNNGNPGEKRASYVPFSRLIAPLIAARKIGARSYNPWFGLNPLASAKKISKDAPVMIIQTTDNPMTPANQGWELYQALPEGSKRIIELNSNVNLFPLQNHTYEQLKDFRINKDTKEKTEKGEATNRSQQETQLQTSIAKEQQTGYGALQDFFKENTLLKSTITNISAQSSLLTQFNATSTQEKINFYRNLSWSSRWTRNIIDGATACSILAGVSYLIYKKTRA